MENNYDNNQTRQGYDENYGAVNQEKQGYSGNYSTTVAGENGYDGNYGTTNQEKQEYVGNNFTTANSQKYEEKAIQNGQEYDGKQWKNGTYNSNQNTNYEKGFNQYGNDLNYVTQKNKNVSSIYGNIYNTSSIPQEKADSFVGAIEQPTYVGGFFGTTSQEPQQSQYSQTGTYVGGYISNNQSTNDTQYYDDCETQGTTSNTKTNLPVKRGFWSKVKTFLFGTEVTIEITEKEQTVLTKIHDFLFQDISLKGFLDILKIGNDKKKGKE